MAVHWLWLETILPTELKLLDGNFTYALVFDVAESSSTNRLYLNLPTLEAARLSPGSRGAAEGGHGKVERGHRWGSAKAERGHRWCAGKRSAGSHFTHTERALGSYI